MFLFLLLSVLILITSACEEGSAAFYTDFNAYEVDPLFREFYDHLGGMEVLGPAISPLFPNDNLKYQYTSASLLVYDPEAPAYQRFHLAPLGLDMGLWEPPVAPPPQPNNLRYVDGHVIFEDFVTLYEKLGGARYVGRPITEVHYNPDTRRYEQHFENVGIYRLEGEPSEAGRLLAYGSWKCSTSCRQIPLANNMVLVPPKVDPQFAETVSRLGTDFTGFAITDPYPTADGMLEQVFENLVLILDPAIPGHVLLRPISQKLGILSDPLVMANGDPTMYFFPIQADQGYNVPQAFLEYMARHGGTEISGAPISELARMNANVYRQCFENMCLEEHKKASGNLWIRPAPLGYQYRALTLQGSAGVQPTPQPQITVETQPQLQPQPTAEVQSEVQPQPTADLQTQVQPQVLSESQEVPLPTPTLEVQPTVATFTDTQSFQELSIQVWEIYPMLASNQSQEIGVSIFENNVPLKMVEPDLVLNLPDGRTKTYYMFPTGEDGQTRIQIEPISAANGVLIPYQVCVINPSGIKFCVKDSFLIWETQ